MIGPSRSGAAASIVSLTDAKAHLRIDHDEDDVLVSALVSAATETVSARTGVVLGAETWAFSVGPQDGALVLPVAPVRSITSISYIDRDGATLAADTDDFRLYADPHRPWIEPVTAWPVVADRPDAITVTVAAGLTSLPDALRVAVMMLAGHWYQHREAASDGVAELPLGVAELIEPWVRQWLAG